MWKNIDKQTGGIVGRITIREIEKATGNILNETTEKNVVTIPGMGFMWKRLTERDVGDIYRLNQFVFGGDYGIEEGGDWTIFLPKPADRMYTKENQFPVYEDFPESIVYNYPDQNTLQVGTLIDGKFVMDTYYPGDVDARYNSATIRFANGEVFSYKRFPVRTISRLVDVQVIWTFTLVDSALFDCGEIPIDDAPPQPSHDFGIHVYAGYWGDNTIHKISPKGDTVWIYNKHTNWVNDFAIDDTYLYSVSRDKSIHVIDHYAGTDYQIIYDAHTDIINRVMVDGEYILTVSNDGYTRKWEMESGDMIWEFNPGTTAFAMDIVKDPEDGSYYTAYRDGQYYKLNSLTGLEMKRWDIGVELVKIAIDKDRNLYLSVYDDDIPGADGYLLHKFSMEFQNIRWTIDDLTGYAFGIKIDDDLNVYVGDDQEMVRMFDRVGDEIWRHTRHTAIVRGLDRDTFGYLYSASIDQTVRKITPNGNQVWAYTGNENPASTVIANLTPEH